MAQKTAPNSAYFRSTGSVEFLWRRGGRGPPRIGGVAAPDEMAPVLHGDVDDGAHGVVGVGVVGFGAVFWRNQWRKKCAN